MSLVKENISNELLCEIHKVLMDKISGEDIGQFRKIQTFVEPRVYISDIPTYNPPTVEYMETALLDFEKFIHNDDNIDILLKTAMIFYQFETISPFMNGNDKMARILVNLFLQEKKILSQQLLCLSSYLLQSKIECNDRISEVQRSGNYKQWIKYFIKGIIVAAADSINIINKLLNLKRKNTAKIMTLGKSAKTAMLLYEYIEQNPIIEIKKTAEELKLSFNTVSKAVEGLQKFSILRQSNNLMRNRCFIYEKYLDII